MRRQARVLAVILWGCGGVWSVTALTAAEEAKDAKDAVFKLINEADSARQLSEALAKLQEAKTLFEHSPKPPGPLATVYIEAELLRFRGRAYLAEWNRHLEKNEIRDQARQELEAAQNKYDQLAALADKAENDLVEKLPPGADPEKNPAVREAVGYGRAARYGAAYTQFALGQTETNREASKEHYRKAGNLFAEFTAEGYKNQAELILLFLNQARCHLELEENEEVLTLLKDAQPANTPVGLYKQIVLLRMQACRQMSKNAEAENQYGKPYFDRLGPNPKYDAADMAIAIARAISLKPLVEAGGASAGEYRARLNRIVELIYSISGPTGDSFKKKLNEALGPQTAESPFFYLTRARRNIANEDLPAALEQINRGLAAADDKTDAALILDLKRTKTEVLLQLARQELSGKNYAAAFDRIEAALPSAEPAMGKTLHNFRAGIFRARAAEFFSTHHFEQALADLDEGLRLEQKTADKTALADLDYLKLAVEYTRQNYPAAYLSARHFLNQYPADRRAENVGTLGVLAGRLALKAAGKPSKKEWNDYLSFLQTSRMRFPDAPLMKQAPWLRAELLIEDGQYREAEQTLRGLGPESPVFLFAQYGLALSAYRQMEALIKEKTDPQKLNEAGEHTITALLHLLEELRRQPAFTATTQTSLPSTLPSTLPATHPAEELNLLPQAVDLVRAMERRLLDGDPSKAEPAIKLLDALDALPAAEHVAVAQRLALRIEAELDRGHPAEALQLVEPLLAYRQKGDRATLRALLLAAPVFSDQLEKMNAAGPNHTSPLAGTMIRAYEEILAEIHAGQDAQLAAQEAGVRSRLGLALAQQELYHKALEHLSWIANNAPNARSARVVRGLAQAYQAAGQFRSAVEQWNLLANNLPKDSAGWYEAQYEQIRCCLSAHQPDQARKMLTMYRISSGMTDDSAWARRFAELDEMIRKDATPTTQPNGR